MGRKHSDVFVLGPEPLDFADFGSRDEKRAEPESDAVAREDPSASPPARGLGHRPLSRRSSDSRPSAAAGLIGRPGRRRPPLRSAAALALAAAALLSPSGGDPGERTPTSPASTIAQAAPTIPPAPPAPLAAPPRHQGAGPRDAIRRAEGRDAQRPTAPSEAPPPTVAPVPAAAVAIERMADSFGFER